MCLVTKDYNTVTFAAHLRYDVLRRGNIGTGRIDDLGILCFELLEFIFGDAVGTDHNRILFLNIIKFSCKPYIETVFKSIYLIFVMDQRSIGDSTPMLLSDLDRPFDPKTKAVT